MAGFTVFWKMKTIFEHWHEAHSAGSDLTLVWLIYQKTLAFPETSQKCLRFHPCLTFTLLLTSVL